MRVTNYEEVLSGALNHPQQRFDEALDVTLQGLQNLHDDDEITGARVFGSAISRNDNDQTGVGILSDLDVIVVTSQYDRRARRRLRHISKDVLVKTAVDLEVTCLDPDQAGKGEHNLLPTMLNWLDQQAGLHPDMSVGTEPSELIQPAQINIVEAVSWWLLNARGSLQKASQPASSQLAWALSVPHVAARKSLDALRYIDTENKLNIQLSPQLTKLEVALEARSIYGHRDYRFQDSYLHLYLISKGLDGFLKNVVAKGLATRHAYSNTIEDMAADAAPEAISVLGRMHRLFNQLATEVT